MVLLPPPEPRQRELDLIDLWLALYQLQQLQKVIARHSILDADNPLIVRRDDLLLWVDEFSRGVCNRPAPGVG